MPAWIDAPRFDVTQQLSWPWRTGGWPTRMTSTTAAHRSLIPFVRTRHFGGWTLSPGFLADG